MIAKDVMRSPVLTVGADATVAELTEVLQTEHVSGVPVVDAEGTVIGVVTEKDVLYGTMGTSAPDDRGQGSPSETRVADIMTAPAVCAGEDTPIAEVCRLMWSFHIHRIPIVRDGKPVGIVAAMDLVRVVADGTVRS